MNLFEQYSDIDIIERINKGETALFEILIRRYNPYLYKVGRSYHFNHEDTQDLMQDTFIDAFIHLTQFENRATFKTWIIRIMLNNCYKRNQKHSFKNEHNQNISENSKPLFSSQQQTDTQQIILNKELNNIIEKALKQVPSDYRMVFSLREMTGLNVAETASLLNISETNVKVRLNRAKTMLKKEIEKSYKAEEIYAFNLVYCDAMVERVMDKIKLL